MSPNSTLWLAAVLGCVAPTLASAQVPADLQAAMHARDSAVTMVDAATWARLTADGFTVVQADGVLMTRAERLTQLKGQQPSPAAARERVDIKHYQDVYVRRFLVNDTWVLDIWAKEPGGWRVVAVQVTTAKK